MFCWLWVCPPRTCYHLSWQSWWLHVGRLTGTPDDSFPLSVAGPLPGAQQELPEGAYACSVLAADLQGYGLPGEPQLCAQVGIGEGDSRVAQEQGPFS